MHLPRPSPRSPHPDSKPHQSPLNHTLLHTLGMHVQGTLNVYAKASRRGAAGRAQWLIFREGRGLTSNFKGLASQAHPVVPPPTARATSCLKECPLFVFARFQVPRNVPSAPQRRGLSCATPWTSTCHSVSFVRRQFRQAATASFLHF